MWFVIAVTTAVLACGDKPEPTPVTTTLVELVRSVTVSPRTAVAFVGDSLTFGAVVTATDAVRDRTVRWTSSSSAVTVNSRGIVTGVQPGSATIAARANADPTVRDTATVTVITRPIAVTR